MTHIVTHIRLLLLLMVVALAPPAWAADVKFPTGSRVGIAPPPAMTASQSFFGFEDRDNSVAIIIVALPAEAYAEIEKTTNAETLKKQGVIFEKREELTLPVGKAFLVTGRQEVEQLKLRKWILVASTPELTAIVTAQVPDTATTAYPEDVLRAALSSVSVRPTVPAEEQLSLLPFKVGDLAGFRIGGLLTGRAVMLTDATPEATGPTVDPHMVIAIAPGGPAQATDRGDFARDVFSTIPNLKDVRIMSAEPLRMGQQQGYQIMAVGKDNASGADVTIVQWLRFGSGAYMHMIGVAPTGAWTPAYARFREVRDGIEQR
jgi:hypothetical protein